jgi:tellurite resistance protein
MDEQDIAIVKGLIPVAWADGVFEDREREMVDAVLDAYRASDAQKSAIHDYAKERRTLDDIELSDLSADDRRILLQHAVLLSFADGAQSTEEAAILKALAQKLRIPDDEAQALLDAGAERAKRYLHLM